jgi:hypothetical protein
LTVKISGLPVLSMFLRFYLDISLNSPLRLTEKTRSALRKGYRSCLKCGGVGHYQKSCTK